MIPHTIDYAEELVNIDLSTAMRWIMVLTDAGEISPEQAEQLRQDIPTEMQEAA